MLTGPNLRWAVLDQTVVEAVSPPAFGGLATINFDGPPAGTLWRVELLTISLNPGNNTAVYVYESRRHRRCQLGGSYQGDFNVWEAAGSPWTVRSTMPLIVEWQGAADGAIGEARAQVRVEMAVPSSQNHPLLGG